jgi:hypothetical protein
VFAPLLILQPAMGAGIASAKTHLLADNPEARWSPHRAARRERHAMISVFTKNTSEQCSGENDERLHER